MSMCEGLPSERCYDGTVTDVAEKRGCGKYEYDCGDGLCIPVTQLCDHKAQCFNGADELGW